MNVEVQQASTHRSKRKASDQLLRFSQDPEKYMRLMTVMRRASRAELMRRAIEKESRKKQVIPSVQDDRC